MSKVYPYRAGVARKWGSPYGYAQDEHGNQVFTGPVRGTKEDAIRDLAGWLEDRDYVHPSTHEVARDLGGEA